MLHRGYMRRGVSLEVIVEEDDNAEVSFDPTVCEDESDYLPPWCSTSSGGNDDSEEEKRDFSRKKKTDDGDGATNGKNNAAKTPKEKEKRRRRPREEEEEEEEEEKKERWRNLGRPRSHSCETLTILDVGDDEFSRERWEEEAREWGDVDCPRGESLMQHSISRRKILASRSDDQNGVKISLEETAVDDPGQTTANDDELTRNGISKDYGNEDELDPENGANSNPPEAELSEADSSQEKMSAGDEDEQQINSLPACQNAMTDSDLNIASHNDNINTDSTAISSSSDNDYDMNHFENDSLLSNHSPDVWLKDTFSDGEDSWITVGELANGIDGVHTEPSQDMETHFKDNATAKFKEVRFSDELEYVNEKQEATRSTASPEQALQLLNHHVSSPSTKEPSAEDNPDDQCRSTMENSQPSENNNSAPNLSTAYCQTCDLPEPPSSPHKDHLVSVEIGRTLFEGRKVLRGNQSPLPDNPGAALENSDIIIVERTATPATEEERGTVHAFTNGCQEVKTPIYNAHNTELHPEELPPPHTVSSVRQIFERLPEVPLHNDDHYSFMSLRFDHVRSNPSSKILRFDGREHREPRETAAAETPKVPPSTLLYPRNLVNGENGAKNTQNKAKINKKPSEASEVHSTLGVHLRKPRLARGFDVRKALMENPKYFHIRMGDRGHHEDAKGGQRSYNANNLGRRNTITYSYVQAKYRGQRGATTTLRWTKETVDRSDSESFSSDSSDDSGVSKDFSSSIVSAFRSSSKKPSSSCSPNNRHGANEYSSDPSFKWIDPSVLRKIRSLGTTVIYFGPRHRPAREKPQAANHVASTYKDDVIFRDANGMSGNLLRNETRTMEALYTSKTDEGRTGNAAGTLSSRVQSPRIVGVTTKANSLDRNKNLFCNVESSSFAFINVCKREVGRTSSTGSNTTVYDFT